MFSSSLIKAGNKPPPTTPGKPKKATTFQEFESITSDAWDVGDDDDELLAMAAQNLNIEVVMETANKVKQRHQPKLTSLVCLSAALLTHPVFLSTEQVIENHSKQQEKQRLDDTAELEHREEDTQEEAAEDEEEDGEEEDRLEDSNNPEVSFASQSSPYTDGRLVKSHSEAPIGSPKG